MGLYGTLLLQDRAQTGAGASRRYERQIVWETVITGRRVESLPVLQEAILGMESRLGLGGEGTDILCEPSTDRDPPGQRLEEWAEHHLARSREGIK